MAERKPNGPFVVMPQEPTQAERPANPFNTLTVLLIAVVLIGAFLWWW